MLLTRSATPPAVAGTGLAHVFRSKCSTTAVCILCKCGPKTVGGVHDLQLYLRPAVGTRTRMYTYLYTFDNGKFLHIGV